MYKLSGTIPDVKMLSGAGARRPAMENGQFGWFRAGPPRAIKLWPGAPCHCQLDWASFQDIVETSDPEPTISVGIEQQAMLAGRIGSAVLS